MRVKLERYKASHCQHFFPFIQNNDPPAVRVSVQLWFSNQSEEYKAEFARRERAVEKSRRNAEERRLLLHKALFHVWPWDEFAPWLRAAILRYLLLALSHKQRQASHRRELRRKRRQVLESAKKEENKNKNLKIESILEKDRGTKKEDGNTEERKGTELHVQRQIDELGETFSPFVVKKFLDLIEAEKAAAELKASEAQQRDAGSREGPRKGKDKDKDNEKGDFLLSGTLLSNVDFGGPVPMRARRSSMGSREGALTPGSNPNLNPNPNPNPTDDRSVSMGSREGSRGQSRSSLSRGDSSLGRNSMGSRGAPGTGAGAGQTANTARSGLGSRMSSRPGTTQLLEADEALLQLFADKMAVLVQSYFRYPVHLTKVRVHPSL